MKIFVTHYTKLVERKEHILREFQKHSLQGEFIEKFDQEVLTKEDLEVFSGNMKISEKSLVCKHLYAYQEIIKKYDYALILEDDVMLDDDFKKKLDMYMKDLPNDWDMFFIGSGCNIHIPKKELISGKCIYKKSHDKGSGATRCTDSYLVSKKCAIKIIEDMKNHKIDKPADWWLNNVLRRIDANVYWAEPTIAKQGTQHKLFKSSIR